MPRRKRRLASRVRDWVRRLLAFLFSNVGVVVLVVAYTIAGAFMFQAIEGASEAERANNMTRERDNTAQYLWQNVTLIFNPLNETVLKHKINIELTHYQRKVVVAVKRGWDGSRSSRQWSFSSAFLYSLTVITTIGYGHLSPRTSWGKVATIFYTLLGMPLFLLYLANVGELLAGWFKCMYALICLCRGCPGFTRRRVARLHSQIEISDAESIEQPHDWRMHISQTDAMADHHFPLDFRIQPYYGRHSNRFPVDYHIPPAHRIPFNNRYSPDQRYQRDRFQEEYRYPPNYRHPLDTRYRRDYYTPVLRYPTHPSNCRPSPEARYPLDNHHYRQTPNYIYPIDSRNPVDYGLHQERYPQDLRYPSHPQRYFQRRSEYIRSASMPQPWNSSRYNDPRVRGWSEPLRYERESQVSSEFSYVTFDAQTITVPLSVCVSILVGYIMFGSMLFGMWERWGHIDGAYFCFISLSSIGFGDFVPGERIYSARIETSFIVCSVYLLLGMALVAMCFNLMQEQVIHYVAGLKRAVKRICRCKR